MKKEFVKISVSKEIHSRLKTDRKKFNLKSIGETILYYINKLK